MTSLRGEVVVEADHRAEAQAVAVSSAHVLWGGPAEVRTLVILSVPSLPRPWWHHPLWEPT